jgi:hypothetical protein
MFSGAVVDTEPEPVVLFAKSSTGLAALDFPNMPLSTEDTFGILIVRQSAAFLHRNRTRSEVRGCRMRVRYGRVQLVSHSKRTC